MADKHAQVLDQRQQAKVMAAVSQGDHSLRNQTMILLSYKAGLRACEIGGLRWKDVCNAEGEVREDYLFVPASITKSKREASLPMHPHLFVLLTQLRALRPDDEYVIYQIYKLKGKPRPVAANAIVMWFSHLYAKCELKGCSSHSGRRTFITTLARKANIHDCSIRDVQKLARHASLATTERYVALSDNVGRLVSAI
jgi:integrase/recombinase XerD